MKPRWLDCWRWFYAIALVRFREIVTQVELADRFLGKPRGANISSPNFSGKTGERRTHRRDLRPGQRRGHRPSRPNPLRPAQSSRARGPGSDDKGRITEDDERAVDARRNRDRPRSWDRKERRQMVSEILLYLPISRLE